MPKKKLTDKQRKFIKEYLIDLNATQAAIRAGYSEKTANRIGPENLSKLVIQEEIKKEQKKREERTEITQDMVVKELAKLGFSNMGDFAKWDNKGVTLSDSDKLNEEQKACVSEIAETITQFGGTKRIKLHDKKGALELLGRHLAMFTDNVNNTGNVNHVITVFKLPENNRGDAGTEDNTTATG